MFSLPKMVGMEFRVLFLPKIVQNGIPKFFSSENGSERNSKVLSLKMVWNGMVFLLLEMVWNGIPRFFSSAKQTEFRRNSRLFRLVSYSAE